MIPPHAIRSQTEAALDANYKGFEIEISIDEDYKPDGSDGKWFILVYNDRGEWYNAVWGSHESTLADAAKEALSGAAI